MLGFLGLLSDHPPQHPQAKVLPDGLDQCCRCLRAPPDVGGWQGDEAWFYPHLNCTWKIFARSLIWPPLNIASRIEIRGDVLVIFEFISSSHSIRFEHGEHMWRDSSVWLHPISSTNGGTPMGGQPIHLDFSVGLFELLRHGFSRAPLPPRLRCCCCCGCRECCQPFPLPFPSNF